jgi:hypothetical protein
MNDVSEITILKEGNVKITNLRAIVGFNTYAISKITSVNMRVNEPKLFLPVFFTVNMGICSVLIAISNMEAYAQCLQTGLYAVITGTLLFLISRKTKYSVYIKIKSAVGEQRILEANDKDYVERIVKAMYEAITLQG